MHGVTMGNELISVSLSPEEKRQIRREAGARDMSMSEFGNDVLTSWLEDNNSSDPSEK